GCAVGQWGSGGEGFAVAGFKNCAIFRLKGWRGRVRSEWQTCTTRRVVRTPMQELTLWGGCFWPLPLPSKRHDCCECPSVTRCHALRIGLPQQLRQLGA